MEKMQHRLARLRERRGWTLAEVGARMGNYGYPTSGESVRQYEAGEHTPRGGRRMALARVYGVSESYLMFGIEMPSETVLTISDPREVALLRGYRQTSPQHQQTVDTLVANLPKNGRPERPRGHAGGGVQKAPRSRTKHAPKDDLPARGGRHKRNGR